MKDETKKLLTTVTRELASANEEESKAKARKELARKKFMELASQALVEDRPLRRKVVDIPYSKIPHVAIQGTPYEQAEIWRLQNEPEWRILDVDSSKRAGGGLAISLEEDPDLMKFTFVNEEIHKVFGRTTEERGAFLDSDALRLDVMADPESKSVLGGAWKRKTVYVFDELHSQLALSVHPEYMPLFQKHSHPGKLSAKLTPIRVAKEEEVD